MATSPAFQLPKDGAIYTEAVFSRCRDLVSYGVWSGIQPHRLDTWIANFETVEERYFAARVLDALIYRSDLQTVALMKQLFQRIIPDLAWHEGLDSALRSIYASLQNDTVDPGVRIVPVIPPGESPTKSGPTVARMLRRHLGFHKGWFVSPDDVSRQLCSVQRLVFVDDFLGTGQQFGEFLSDTGLHSLLSSACFIYAPLAGHTKGLMDLRLAFPALHINAVELLDDSQAFFHEASGSFPDGVNSTEVARDFYYGLMERRKIGIHGADRRGFGHFELAYAFEHAVPDNSLPILWWADSDDWRPLFDR